MRLESVEVDITCIAEIHGILSYNVRQVLTEIKCQGETLWAYWPKNDQIHPRYAIGLLYHSHPESERICESRIHF